MSASNLGDYLASGEELLVSFTAESVSEGDTDSDNGPDFAEMVEGDSNSKYTFGATDRRIVYLEDDGSFKDIDYSHISSIESGVEEDVNGSGTGAVLGCCGGVVALGGVGKLASEPGTAIIMVILGGAAFAIGLHFLQDAETVEKQTVKFITGDESHQQIEVTLTPESDENIGAQLSQLLREQRSPS